MRSIRLHGCNSYTSAVIYKNQMLLFVSWLQFIPFRDRKNINIAVCNVYSVFNYKCLMGCSPPEMPRCWHIGGSGKLFTFCLSDREFYQSFLWGFLLFSFTKLSNL